MQTNILPLILCDPSPETGLRLSLGRELEAALWQCLRFKASPSILCGLRAEGLPHVRLSERHFRYEIPLCLEWMLIRSAKNNFMTPSNVHKLTSRINDNTNKGA